MRIHTSVVLAGMMSASLVCAENLTQKNVEKAQKIIAAAVEAHGGEARLESMQTLFIEHETINIATGQSLKAAPPWDRNPASGMSAVDYENEIFVTRNKGAGGGFEFDNGTIINSDDSFQLNYRAGTVAAIAEPDFATTSGPFMRVTPPLLVRTLKDRAQNAYFLGDTEIDGQAYDVVGFSMTVGPAISLYFDKQDHLLRRSERVLPGFGLVEYRFNDYESVDGIAFNQTFELYLNGDANIERTNVTTVVNDPIDDLVEPDDRLANIPPVVPDALTRNEVAEGVYLIGGSGTYAMFVEMDDYVVAVGGTAGIPDRIELLREVVPEKPIRYGVMTHHHFDHVLGVSSYEAEGATVVAAEAHEAVVRDAADDSASLKLQTVSDRMIFEDRNRRIEIVDIGPTAHTEHLLIGYLPQEGIVFEGDHFAMPQAGPVPPAVSSTKTFAKALIDNDIDADRFLSAHSPRVGTMQDLRAAIDKEVIKVSQQ